MGEATDKPKILVVAGDDYLKQLPKILCPEQSPKTSGEFQIIRAGTVEEALAYLKNNDDIAAIVTTPHINDPLCGPQAVPLVKHLAKSGFQGPIILVCYSRSYQQMFLEEGCTHAANKENVADVLREALEIGKH